MIKNKLAHSPLVRFENATFVLYEIEINRANGSPDYPDYFIVDILLLLYNLDIN